MNNLGIALESGRGVEKNEEAAALWYRRAAEAGHGGAMFGLGRLKEFGLGVSKDEAEAVAWYRRGVEVGNPKAMFQLGRMLQSRSGTNGDIAEAEDLFRRAVKGGLKLALPFLGVIMEARGEDHEAVACYREAAEASIPAGMYYLGRMLIGGRGVAFNEAMAFSWCRRAADSGYEPAAQFLRQWRLWRWKMEATTWVGTRLQRRSRTAPAQPAPA